MDITQSLTTIFSLIWGGIEECLGKLQTITMFNTNLLQILLTLLIIKVIIELLITRQNIGVQKHFVGDKKRSKNDNKSKREE